MTNEEIIEKVFDEEDMDFLNDNPELLKKIQKALSLQNKDFLEFLKSLDESNYAEKIMEKIR